MDKSSSPQNLFQRHPQNPILSASDWPYPAHTVFNPAAVLLPDGETLLLCRVEDFRGFSHLCAARSQDGVAGWRIDPQPTLPADPQGHPEEAWGIEDPRLTYLPELGKYALTYTAYSGAGPAVALALTADFESYERLGVILPAEDKDAALFPRRFAGEWAIIHRPVNEHGAHVWLSSSPDLRQWDEPRLILRARQGGWWDAGKVGLCSPPIETPEGWLCLYHGVRVTASGSLYRVGLALFDRDQPERCLLRSDEWIFGPEEPYERSGDVGNVVFPCGFTLAPDGDTLRIYYGAADTSIGLATASLGALLEWLKRAGRPPEEGRGG